MPLPADVDSPRGAVNRRNEISNPSASSLNRGRFGFGEVLAGRYRIIDLLGKGGMGEVYRAEDIKLDTPVALKFLPQSFSQDPEALSRLYREVAVARQVSHRNVCRVYDIGEYEGQHFISMELVRGEELGALLKRIGRFPQEKAVDTARQLCAGLAAIHEKGILHRDLKPNNVMIDELGNVRITDFGLATTATPTGDPDNMSGTPAYMSPEQLSGKVLTVRSDIYSLGLVLYELFTGKRAFDSTSLPELVRMRTGDASPPSITSAVKGTDPVIEQTVSRCLEADPARRPTTALQVAAMLPGGDPLAAALAMGEIPSPEMVAASPKEGTLRPAVAALYVAGIFAALAFVLALGSRTELNRMVPLEKSSDVLRERARSYIRDSGYGEPTDSFAGWEFNRDYLKYIRENDNSMDRWSRLRTDRASALYFWYRESPRSLVPYSGWQVSTHDPPSELSGMVDTKIDSSGHLISFYAVPPQVESDQTSAPAPPNWQKLFEQAGLDPAQFASVDPRWLPPSFADSRAAWEGLVTGKDPVPIRIEAAAYKGRPVSFDVIFPWDEPKRQAQAPESSNRPATGAILFGLSLLVLIGASLLARRNYRLGLGDFKGSLRLAFVVLLVECIHWMVAAHHVTGVGEMENAVYGISRALLFSAWMWILYLALEPFGRRRWPQLIISWSRLLSGDWRDPLIGRDVLIGGFFGLVMAALGSLWTIAPGWFGLAPHQPNSFVAEALTGITGFIHGVIVESVGFGLLNALSALFILTLLAMAVRRDWLTALIAWALLTTVISLAVAYTWIDIPFGALSAAIFIFVIMRFGIVAIFSTAVFSFWIRVNPMTTDVASWYWGYTLFLVIWIAVIVFCSYKIATAGKPLFQPQT